MVNNTFIDNEYDVGITQGHSLTLKIVGVGFKAEFLIKNNQGYS